MNLACTFGAMRRERRPIPSPIAPMSPPRLPDELSCYTDLTRIPTTADALVAILDANGNVLLLTTPPTLQIAVAETAGRAARRWSA